MDEAAFLSTTENVRLCEPGASGLEGTRMTGSDALLRQLLSCSIHDLQLSARSYNALKGGGINTLADLVSMKERDVLRLKNMGKRSLIETKSLLLRMGLGFEMGRTTVEAVFNPSPDLVTTLVMVEGAIGRLMMAVTDLERQLALLRLEIKT